MFESDCVRPSVSIGLPVYNGMPLLQRALDSLLGQSFRDFELIISDNASTDDTRAVCEALASRDSRIRYIRQPRNLGAIRNFDFLLRQARAPYFMWAAHDDEWDQHYVAYLKAKLDSDPTCVGAFGSWCGIDDTGRITSQGGPLQLDAPSALNRLFALTFGREDKCIYGLFRSAAMKQLGIYPWRFAAQRAEEQSHTWLFHLVSQGKIAECPDTTFFYRDHAKPHFPASAMLRVKLNQIFRTLPTVWRATHSPTVTVAAVLMNSAYQLRNFSWMMFKRRFGMAHVTRAEVKQMAARWIRRRRFVVWTSERP
jgi:glycosyltransferase involved in cell wall biosynthesis